MTRRTWGFKPWNSGLAIQVWCLRVLLGAVLLPALALPSFAGGQGNAGDPHALRITVRVFSYAPVRRTQLVEALKEATLLFAQVDVEMEWVLCHVSSEESEEPAACSTLWGPGEFALRILPNSKGMPSTSRDALGFAMVVPGAQDSYLASLFYNHVEAVAEGTHCDRTVVLSHAMAHELGHLLLGTPGHSTQGLMRAHWDTEDVRLAQRRSFGFTPQQADQIHAGLRARLRVSQASLRDAAKGF